MATRFAGALRLAVALVTVGCRPAAPVARPYPPPTADTLHAVLIARQQALRSMNARVRATSWIGGERLRATVLMLVDRAGRLRFEAEVSLQGTVSILATDGQQFALLDLQKNQLHRGPACPENVASMIRIPLRPPEVAALLLGDLLWPADARAEVTWDSSRGADVLQLTHGDGTSTQVVFQRRGNQDDVVGVTRMGPQGRLWRVSFEEMETVGALRLPSLIRFAERDQSFDEGVDIKFRDRAVNVPLRSEDFFLTAPPGTPTVDVGCGA